MKDPISRVALATLINLVAAPMVSQSNKDRMAMVAIVHKPNINVAQTELLLLKEKTLLDAHVLLANTDVVRMALMTHKDHSLRDVTRLQLHHKRRVVSIRMVVVAAITLSNTSSIWNMEVAHDSGTVVAAEMPIVSKQLMSAREHANNQLAKMLAKCQRFMVHARDTIRNSTTIQTAISVHHLFMVVAWAIRTDSNQLKSVNNNVLLMKHCVRLFFSANECFFFWK